MKSLLLAAFLAIAAMAGPVVTYSVTGDFTPGVVSSACDPSAIHTCQTYGSSGGSVRYLMGSGSVDLTLIHASNISFGSLYVDGTVGDLSGIGMKLNIHQTSPAMQDGSLDGTLSGQVLANSSSAFLYFPTPVLQLGDIKYEVLQTASGTPIMPPSIVLNGAAFGLVTLNGQVSVNSSPGGFALTHTPEPATFGFAALGLGTVWVAVRRRRA